MQIHIFRNGERYGPYNLKDINAYLASGTLLSTDLAWQDGMTDWLPISQIPSVIMPGGSVPAPIPTSQPSSTGSRKKVLIGIVAGVVFLAIMAGVWFFLIPGRENMGTGKAIGQLIGKSMGAVALIAIIWSFADAIFGTHKGGGGSSSSSSYSTIYSSSCDVSCGSSCGGCGSSCGGGCGG